MQLAKPEPIWELHLTGEESYTKTNMLRISNVCKQFGNIAAIVNLSLEVKQGEIYALIGPNGSGKTTTLKLIADIYKQDKGRIAYHGRLGYIPDEPLFYTGLSGYETINFVAALYNLDKKEKEKQTAKYLQLFPMRDVFYGAVENYSRGNRQKLAIITQLLIKPDLLLIDEPVVGLDPPSAQQALTLFNDYAARGGTVLLCTHTLSVVDEIADRVGFLKQGKLLGELTQKELKQKGNLYRLFVKMLA